MKLLVKPDPPAPALVATLALPPPYHPPPPAPPPVPQFAPVKLAPLDALPTPPVVCVPPVTDNAAFVIVFHPADPLDPPPAPPVNPDPL